MGNAPSETLSLEYIDMHHVPKTCFNYTAAARDTGEQGMHLIKKKKISIKLSLLNFLKATTMLPLFNL